jgi:type I restriction enzyme, S subunit
VKAGWTVSRLADLTEKITKGSSPKWQGISYVEEPGVLFVTSENVLENRIELTKKKYVDDSFNVKDRKSILKIGDVLTNIVGASIGRTAVFDQDDVANINQAVCLIRCLPDKIDNRFLSFLLNSPFFLQALHSGKSDMARANLSLEFFRYLEIPLPPLEEQQQIVAVLDEAFEGLARARAHAEANLRDARELFQSALRGKMKPGNHWRAMLIGDTTDRTKVPSKIQRKDYLDEGQFPIVSQEAGLINGYWNNPADVVRVKRPLVVFGDHTRGLKYVDFDFVVGADGTQLMCPISALDPLFYLFALRIVDLAGKGYARHYSHLKKETIWFPEDTTIQRKIAADLEEMEREIFDLEARYATKIQDIDALRQSLLQKAFAGELT